MAHLLWNGIRYRWRRTSHRLAWLGTGFSENQHDMSLKIGAFPPDIADYTAWFTRIPASPDITVKRGVATGLRPSGFIGQAMRARSTVTVPLGEGAVPVHAVALLGGFRIKSVGNRSGWHFGRLGIQTGPPRPVPDGFAFDVDVVLRPSEAPEIFHIGNRGWSYDRDCSYDIEVDWVFVAAPPDRLPIEPRRWSSTVLRGLTVERTDELRVGCPPGVRPERCPAVGLRAFDVEVDAIARQRRFSRILRYYTGRNIREFGLWMELDHDEEAGVSLLRPGIAFSNGTALGWTLPLLVTLVMAGAAVAGWMIGGTMGSLLLALAFAMAVFGLAWPGGPLALPSVPWSLTAAIECSLLYLPDGMTAEAGSIVAVHEAPEEPYASAAQL